MALIVSASVTNPAPGGLGMPVGLAEDVFANHTQKHLVKTDGGNHTLYSKPSADGVDLICVYDKGADQIVAFGLRAFPDLCDASIADMPPLDLLQELTKKFGLQVRIGKSAKKLYVNDAIKVQSADMNKILNIVNPQNSPFVASLFIRIKDGVAEISLAFCIETTAYSNWVQSH